MKDLSIPGLWYSLGILETTLLGSWEATVPGAWVLLLVPKLQWHLSWPKDFCYGLGVIRHPRLNMWRLGPQCGNIGRCYGLRGEAKWEVLRSVGAWLGKVKWDLCSFWIRVCWWPCSYGNTAPIRPSLVPKPTGLPDLKFLGLWNKVNSFIHK